MPSRGVLDPTFWFLDKCIHDSCAYLVFFLLVYRTTRQAPRTLVRWRAREQAPEPKLRCLGLAVLLGLTQAQAPCLAPARVRHTREIASVHAS